MLQSFHFATSFIAFNEVMTVTHVKGSPIISEVTGTYSPGEEYASFFKVSNLSSMQKKLFSKDVIVLNLTCCRFHENISWKRIQIPLDYAVGLPAKH